MEHRGGKHSEGNVNMGSEEDSCFIGEEGAHTPQLWPLARPHQRLSSGAHQTSAP